MCLPLQVFNLGLFYMINIVWGWCRNGDIVSGDSNGSTQFWDGQLGTLLSVQCRHDADVLALAASHDSVFAAGADGKVIQFQQVGESLQMNSSDDIDVARGTVGEKWVYVGSKRTHTHDVRALAIVTPIVAPIVRAGTPCFLFVSSRCHLKHFDGLKCNHVFIINFSKA